MQRQLTIFFYTANGKSAMEDFHQPEKDRWVMQGSVKGVLNCWNSDGNAAKKRRDRRLSQHVYGVQSGEKENRDASRISIAIFRSSR